MKEVENGFDGLSGLSPSPVKDTRTITEHFSLL